MKNIAKFVLIIAVLILPINSYSQIGNFNIRSVSEDEFYKFVKIFSEMRGPIRNNILKDRKTNFEDADPLKYVEKVKDEKDVKKMLKDNGINWEQFTNLMGNILLGYFSIQPGKTKAALIKQLSDYGLFLSDADIPEEYRKIVKEAIKTDEGANMAGIALEYILQIPGENKNLAQKNNRTLDQLFYTKFWKDKI